MNYKLALPPLLVFLVASAGLAEQFRNPVRLATPSDPDAVIVADLNRDGRMDLIWATHGTLIGESSSVQAFLAQPDGSFSAAAVMALPIGVTPYCQVADETGDGRPDLICPYADQFSASLYVFPGNGDGTFGNPIETALPSGQNYGVYWGPLLGAPADFNGDGVADFVVANAEAYVGFVVLGNGDGTFKVVTQKNKSATYFGDDTYQALDVNGDGHLDLLFSGGAVLLGDGTGQFAPPAGGGGAAGVFGLCTFGKVDGEPHIDEVCGQEIAVDGDIVGGTELLIFHGNGDGSFRQTPIKTIIYGDRLNEYDGYGTFMYPIAVADLDGDGIPDIVAEAADGLTVLLGKPGINFAYPAHYATGADPTSLGTVGRFAWRLADVNGDGIPDLVESGPNGVYITYGRPNGILDTAPAYEVTSILGYETVADFNGDGIPDIAATGGPAIELSLGKGDGTFEYRMPLPQGDADFSADSYTYIVHGDFNGDHRQDILAAGSAKNQSNQYNNYILFGHGNGTFTAPAAVSLGSTSFPTSPAPQVFDFNGDGKDDLFNFDTRNFYVALSDGDGSFKTVVTTAASDANLQTQPAIADLNGDGKLDAVIGGLASVEIFLGRGSGAFNASGPKLAIPQYNGVATQGSIAVSVGDFDGDGYKDIALLATAGYNSLAPATRSVLFIYFGNGDGTFSEAVPVTAFNREYSNLYAADLNKDGRDDLVLTAGVGIDFTSTVGIVHGLPGRTFSPEVNYIAGPGLDEVSIVDLNRDGFPDLVFANGDLNTPSNSVTVLMNLGNTTGVTGAVYALPEPSDTSSSFRLVASLDPPDQSALSGSVSFFVDGQAAGSAALVDNQAEVAVKTALTAGLHTLKATWPGGGNFAAVTLAGKHQVTNGYPTSTTLTCNYTASSFLTPITFSATVESTSGTPAGSLILLDGKSRLATLPLAGGIATFVTPALTPGTHTITAQFAPAAGWATSSATLQQQVNPVNVTAKMTASSKHAYALQSIELTATVMAPAGGPPPTGTVQFNANFSSILGSGKLVNGTAKLTASVGGPGYTTFSAQYSGNQDYATSYAEGPTLDVLVNPTVTRVHATPNPASAGESVKIAASVTSTTVTHPAPTGSVTFFDNGGQLGSATLVNGSATIALTSLAVGKHPIAVAYSGDGNFSASQANTLSLAIIPATSTTNLSASPNPANAGAKVTFKAVVKGPRQPTGSVVFLDGTTKLSAAIQVDFEGAATYSTSSLAAGKHSITTHYSGDPNLDASTSAPLSVTINP